MNRYVQFLLIVVLLVPLTGMSREETMEERKLRITRKYLRERAKVSENNLLMPVEELPEDEQIADSEKFKEAQVDILRQETDGMPLPVPPRRRPRPKMEDRNWLLAEDPMAEDSYADPFSTPDSGMEDHAGDSRDVWERRTEEDSYSSSRSAERYDRRSYEPYAERMPSSRQGGISDPWTQRSEGYQRGLQNPYPSGSAFGRQREDSSTLGWGSPSGSSQATDFMQSPFGSPSLPSSDRTFGSPQSKRREQGWIPYQSPYQKREERYPSPATRQEQPQEFRRVDPYRKWKEKSNSWDPTGDDAYLDELMRHDRR